MNLLVLRCMVVVLTMLSFGAYAEDEAAPKAAEPAAVAINTPVAKETAQANVSQVNVSEPAPASATEVAPVAAPAAVQVSDETVPAAPVKPAAPVFEKGSIGDVLSDPQEKFADFTDISRASIKDFYKARDYKPIWIQNGAWSDKAKQALKVLNAAQEEGLFPQDYDVKDLPLNIAGSPKEKLNFLDANLTAALMQYIVDVRFGRRELRKTNEDRTKSADPDPRKFLNEGLKATDFHHWITSLPPQRPEYQSLKRLLATKHNANEPQLPPVPAGNQLKLGDRDDRVKLIHEHLAMTGDLELQPLDPYLYSIDTQEAIKSFQSRHNLRANGVLNPATRQAMNKPGDHLVHKIVLNMERWRWLPHHTSRKYVLVNVAGFMLYGFNNNKLTLEKRVIVGNEYRQTPIFSAPMTSVKFNPTWTVPPKIAAKDLLPQIQSNPNFFNEFGMQVIAKGGGKIDPYSVNWGGMSARNFPYTLHQLPGSTNALGKIRFTIDNAHNVYLHDTNAREKFNSDVRTLSSGCIRVQDPAELASFVLGDSNRWGIQNVKVAMQGTRTNVVSLPEKVDVHMVYATVFVDANGETHYYNDVYNRDNHLMRLLAMDQKWKSDVQSHAAVPADVPAVTED